MKSFFLCYCISNSSNISWIRALLSTLFEYKIGISKSLLTFLILNIASWPTESINIIKIFVFEISFERISTDSFPDK